MTDDLGAHDVDELRALMRTHHLLPEVPASLGTAADPETTLARILAAPRPGTSASTSATATSAGPSELPATSRRTSLRRRGAALAVAAAAAVVAVVGSQVVSAPGAVAGGPPQLSYSLGSPADAWDASLPSAHDALLHLAGVADDAPDLSRTGDVQYVALYSWLSELDMDTRTTTVYPTADQRWTAADGSSQIIQRRAEPVTYDGAIDTAAGPSAAGATSTTDVLAGTNDPFAVAALPTDPEALTASLLEHSAEMLADDPGARDSVLVKSVAAQFDLSIVPQDVAAAMWTVLADAPTVRLVGETTDRLGRPAVAVAVADTSSTSDGYESVDVLIISPTDGQLMGTETVTLSDPVLKLDAEVDQPTVTGFTAFSDRRWVTAVGR